MSKDNKVTQITDSMSLRQLIGIQTRKTEQENQEVLANIADLNRRFDEALARENEKRNK